MFRSVSESNIVFRPDDSLLLTGFEFAKPQAAAAQLTSLDLGASRDALPTYIAPEQLLGQTATAKTDVFCLGCVLYRALTGVSPPSKGCSIR